ncbi:hypothetical protein BM536_006210 [Streptomyces phaeoluteigriseus]|uniref:Uncharacterized protein n=1 Tax=Streptomyces phaeoluteigriseus TaxID=114686 RepID=A0A1V6MXD7_9ACTN|nr:hypothetical protein [Streptomyces phaeoluteigriseus]OQD56953.1 hypothetical protein BM536_006210 [Streptomyces phaeoluteigriseus]
MAYRTTSASTSPRPALLRKPRSSSDTVSDRYPRPSAGADGVSAMGRSDRSRSLSFLTQKSRAMRGSSVFSVIVSS